MGRPTKLTTDLVGQLAAAVEEGATRNESAAAVGIAGRTLKRWLQAGRSAKTGLYRTLADRIEAADLAYCRTLKCEIFRIGKDGDWRALAFLLEHRLNHVHQSQKMRLEIRALKAELKEFKARSPSLREPTSFDREAEAMRQIVKDTDPAEFDKLYAIPTPQQDEIEAAEEAAERRQREAEAEAIQTDLSELETV